MLRGPLTEREIEILRLIDDGLSNVAIAARLQLALGTVKVHTRNIFHKLDVNSRADAVARAKVLRVLSSPDTTRLTHTILNLPAQPTPFIGRENDLTKICARLTDDACHLVTLVGPGGIGKTRLAVQVALQSQSNFQDGVCFVPLQPVSSAQFLASALAEGLRLQRFGREDERTQLIRYLREKNLLLVLDNFEHLLEEGAGLLTDMLEASPGLKLLVTSREVLNMRQEWVWPVSGMAVPENSYVQAPEAYSAVRLFVEHARRIRPDFTLDNEQDSVIRICQQVAGMPLALELAASWLKVLPCKDIADEIQRGLDFLQTNLRDIPQRHRSIHAVFEQSWHLLADKERDVFKRVTVFQGSFTREAAEAVAGASLRILSALVDKSLLNVNDQGRYHLHELLRQYGQEKLEQDAELAAQTRDAHCDYYAEFLRVRTSDIQAKRQRAASAEIAAELENVRSAWARMVQQANADALMKSYLCLMKFYDIRSQYNEAIDAFKQAVNCLGETNVVRGALLTALGWSFIRVGQPDHAAAAFETALAIYDSANADYPHGLGMDPRTGLSVVAMIRGQYDAAETLAKTALRHNEARGDYQNQMLCFNILSSAAHSQGDYQQAYKYAQSAYTVAKAINNEWFCAYSLNEMGNAARARKDFATAQQCFSESLRIRQSFDDPEGVAVALAFLGKTALQQGDYSRALQLLLESLAIYEKLGDKGGLSAVLHGLASANCALGRYEAASWYFLRALRALADTQLITYYLAVLVGVGELMVETGRETLGLRLLRLALSHPASDHETRDRAAELLDSFRISTAGIPEINLEQAVTEAIAQLEIPAVFTAPYRSEKTVDSLSQRELEILRLLAEGYSNEEIAERLVVVVGTVKAHNHHIFSKLGVKNRAQAVVRARELRLL